MMACIKLSDFEVALYLAASVLHFFTLLELRQERLMFLFLLFHSHFLQSHYSYFYPHLKERKEQETLACSQLTQFWF